MLIQVVFDEIQLIQFDREREAGDTWKIERGEMLERTNTS